MLVDEDIVPVLEGDTSSNRLKKRKTKGSFIQESHYKSLNPLSAVMFSRGLIV